MTFSFGREAYSPTQLALFQQQVAAAEGSRMFPGNFVAQVRPPALAFTSAGQVTTSAQATAALQQQIVTLSDRVNALQRRMAAMPQKDPLGLFENPQVAIAERELRPLMAQLQALRDQLAQAQQGEPAPKPKSTGKARTDIATSAPAPASGPGAVVIAEPGTAPARPNYLLPALVVGAVALLAGGYLLTRPR